MTDDVALASSDPVESVKDDGCGIPLDESSKSSFRFPLSRDERGVEVDITLAFFTSFTSS